VKIFIIGGSGFLGWNLVQDLLNKHEIISTYFSSNIRINGVKTIYSDITDYLKIEQEIKATNPDIVINCSGLTKVQECQDNPHLAFKLNCEAVFNLSLLIERMGIKLIHFSTDLVYAGDSDGFYSENSSAKPFSIYGKTKLLSETIVANNCSDFIVFRLALLYGFGNGYNNSFIDWIEKSVKENQKLRFYNDQMRSMLYVKDVAKVIEIILENNISKHIINLGGNMSISRFDFGAKFLELFYSDYKNIINTSLKNEENSKLFGYNCSMNISKLRQLLNFEPKSIDEGLNDMKIIKQPDHL
jgi:dTDP-4-dehydrorhamnose reductase